MEENLLNEMTQSQHLPLASKSPPPPPPAKHCWRCAFLSSIAANVAALVTGIFFFFITSAPYPHPPLPTPTFNGSCPYAHNASVYRHRPDLFKTVEFAVYEIGTDYVKMCWPVMPHALRDTAPYLIEVDDWFTQRTTFKTAYAGSTNEFVLTGLLPGQPLSIRMKVSPHVLPGTKVMSSKTLSLQTKNASYCGNLQDITVLRNASHNGLALKLQNCALQKNGVACIEKGLGFTEGCSTCFAGENSCIIQKCVDKNKFICLLKPKSVACKACINNYCMGKTAACGGLPLWALNVTSFPLTPS